MMTPSYVVLFFACIFVIVPKGRSWILTSRQCTRGTKITSHLYATTASVEDVSVIPALPLSLTDMKVTAVDAIKRAYADGLTRQRVRILLSSPRVPNQLVPPDETWEGGIMQLYYACSPVVRSIVRQLSLSSDASAVLTEQRLDESGVDGESLWTSECASARDDVSAFVQPSSEQLRNIKAVCSSAQERLVLMVNPQYRDSDDTLDYIASNGGGVFAAMANFLGGKASFVSELDDLGFTSTFILEQYVIRGSELKYFLAYPYDWKIYITGDQGESIFLGESKTRPNYNKVDDLLQANKVAVKAARDLNQAPKLTAESITVMYDEISS